MYSHMLMGIPVSEMDILAKAEEWLAAGHSVALGTVVQTTGSAPRQTGSHVVVREDGAFLGSVSAGCVENEIIEIAIKVLKDGVVRRMHFGDGDGIFGPNLLCGGQITVLVEPIR